jgi:carbonic anhydrase
VLEELGEGNRRFRECRPKHVAYPQAYLKELALAQHPKVAIVACADSRVSPDIIFDQPLGTIFSSRVPGNVASDSAKWMLEIALGEFKVPLVMIVGHTGCLAVGQLLDGDKGGAGGTHRWAVSNAVYRAKMRREGDLYLSAIEENVAQTVEHLVRDLRILRSALMDGTTSIAGAVYDMQTGHVRLIDTHTELYGKF